ncbi:MAG: cytochrome P450 [Ferroplasma sp.]|uniref:cytochrome P450 n=1 Tax=Ferroplasma sp. TaxID=2591003 RepID=UPI00281548AD|nr:cytochrome P450 [Ferroplasma sp.]WMT50791.1 MAG: cytochrome P450 [Ferroplasma sp.]
MTQDIFSYYSKMRCEDPVSFNRESGSWDVFDYEDVYYVLMHNEIFSSDPSYSGRVPDGRRGPGASFITIDNPDHKELRNISAPFFLPSSIEKYSEHIKKISSGIISSLKPDQDFISGYAVGLPVNVISDLLGVPESERQMFKTWSDYIIGNRRDGGFDQINRYMYAKMSEIFSDKQGDDIMSVINRGSFKSAPLSNEQKIGYVMLLVIGGNETTTNLLGNMVKVLSENPGIQELLRENREYYKNFIEETLRYYSPIQFLPHRFAAENHVLHGRQIKKGDKVSIWLGSANRDEKAFDNPEEFMINRRKNNHLAFGMGVHMCLGAPLARLEAEIGLGDILGKFDSIKVNRKKSKMLDNPMVYGFSELYLE